MGGGRDETCGSESCLLGFVRAVQSVSREKIEVAPRVTGDLGAMCDAAVSMCVVELEQGCSDFNDVEPTIRRERSPYTTPHSHQSINIVKPEILL